MPHAMVHIGYGAFHRAHQALYVQKLADQGLADWSIYAVNLRESDRLQFAVEAGKPGYDLKTYSADGRQQVARIDRHRAFFDWAEEWDLAEAALAKPEVTLATVTVSEAGYYFDSAGDLDLSHPILAAETAGESRQSLYAYLTGGLAARRAAGTGALTILCCDNLRNNGAMLAQNLRTYLHHLGRSDLADWVAENCTFPCSMVDRITPAPVTLARPNDCLGTSIFGEDFIQWVVEDNFCALRPPLEHVGGSNR